MEAKPVKKMRLHFFYSAVIANSKLDYSWSTCLGRNAETGDEIGTLKGYLSLI